MSHRIATDATFNAYCPKTRGREELEAEDERTSHELAVRCGLKSVRGDAPKPNPRRGPAPTPKPKPTGPRVYHPLPIQSLTTGGLRRRMIKVARRIQANPSDPVLKQRAIEVQAEWDRRQLLEVP